VFFLQTKVNTLHKGLGVNEHFVTLLELLQVLVLIPYVPSFCPNGKSLLKQLQQEIALYSIDYLT